MERQPPSTVLEDVPGASGVAQPDRVLWLWATLVIVVAAFAGFVWITLRRTAQIVRPPVSGPVAGVTTRSVHRA